MVRAPLFCQYAALSYLWGGIQQPMLTSANAAFFVQPYSLLACPLPKTVKDAIFVCAVLKLSYLWVDSLCIRQDDLQEVYVETSNMHQVYTGAYVTLVAAWGSDCSSGLLHAPESALPYAQYTATIGDQIFVAVPESIKVLDERVRNSTWNTRAWTMQEDALPRRCLIFTRCEYLLYCGKGASLPMLREPLPHSQVRDRISLLDQIRSASSLHSQTTAHLRYSGLASLYVRRKSSYGSDVLRAF